MHRKHYQAIAEIVRDNSFMSDGQKEELGEDLADYLEGDNPKFLRDKFLAVVKNEG